MQSDLSARIERVYRSRYGAFLRVAVAILHDEQLAEEAVHDAFVRALRYRRRYDEARSLEAWLWRIVVNEARRRRTVEQRWQSVEAQPADPAATTNGHRDHGPVAALVAALPERQR